MNRFRQLLTTTALMLCVLPSAVYGLQYGTPLTKEIRGYYPVIDEVAASGNAEQWQIGMTLTIPTVVTPKLGPLNDGEAGTYVFLDNDRDDRDPVPVGMDISHSTINWYIVPKGTNQAAFDTLRRVNISLSLSGPMRPGERVLIGTGSTIRLPALAFGNQVGFSIIPKTSIGFPNESPMIIVPDIRFMQGQIDPNEPNVEPQPDPELPVVINPGVPPEELPEDPTLGEPKIYIFRKDEWEQLGTRATPVDTETEDFTALVEVETEYVARVLRDEYIPYTATLADDTDVTAKISKPIKWYLYSFEGETEIVNAIDGARLSFYNGIADGMYKTQIDNDDATMAAKLTEEKSEQKLRLRAGFLWDPEDVDKWPAATPGRPVDDEPVVIDGETEGEIVEE